MDLKLPNVDTKQNMKQYDYARKSDANRAKDAIYGKQAVNPSGKY